MANDEHKYGKILTTKIFVFPADMNDTKVWYEANFQVGII